MVREITLVWLGMLPLWSGDAIYEQLREFRLAGTKTTAARVEWTRDGITVRFDGDFHPEAPVQGRVRGFVFIGRGSVSIEPPDAAYERENLRRFLKADRVESDFRTAVFRFTDTTWNDLQLPAAEPSPVPEPVMKLSREFKTRLLRENALNVDARVATAIYNREPHGFVLAQFDEGRLGRFTVALDPAGRVPSAFGLNAGEQGVVFAYNKDLSWTDVWVAMPSLTSLVGSGSNPGSDLLRARKYSLNVDTTGARSARMSLQMTLEAEILRGQVRAIPFSINEQMTDWESIRLKKAMRCRSVKLEDGAEVPFAQEDWESGITVFFPKPLEQNAPLRLTFTLEGDGLLRAGDAEIEWNDFSGLERFQDVYYPRMTTSWYPTHGFLQRAAVDLAILHREGHKAIGIGVPFDPGLTAPAGARWTGWRMKQPVAMACFAVGSFTRNGPKETRQGPGASFYMPATLGGSDDQEFVLTELSNSVQFFAQLFGPYPFEQVSAVVHPRLFGQSFPSLIFLSPTSKSTNKYEFAFYAHEMSHQWWGHVVSWKTYRDQWLSEGFAQYSATLYVRARMNREAELDLVRSMRRTLLQPPYTDQGIGAGRVADLGPLILGLRAASRKTQNAYMSLVYNKGALVLRMLHMLFTNPATGDDSAFYTMMKDFTSRHAGRAAGTEDFFAVASEHFRRTPLAAKYRLENLDWFERQYVRQAELPSYRLEYRVEKSGEGVTLRGTVHQTGAPADWFTPLPLLLKFGEAREARGTVEARGAKTEFAIPLPAAPAAVLLDPEMYVLSAKTETEALRN